MKCTGTLHHRGHCENPKERISENWKVNGVWEIDDKATGENMQNCGCEQSNSQQFADVSTFSVHYALKSIMKANSVIDLLCLWFI